VKSARVLIAGTGGLGSAAAHYLLAGGIGYARLVDESRVDLSDLNQQILFRERDLGKARATVAQHRLQEINSFALVEGHVKIISEQNLSRLTSGCNILIDASNNSLVSILLNRAAVKMGIPLVHARVWGMTGQLTTFWPGRGPCLACASLATIHPIQPALLGPLAGIMGSLQALEGLKILGGLGATLLGRLLIFQGSQFKVTERLLEPNPQCPACRAAAGKTISN
jgi:molybdopterin/thiamine biosynthesis adenylyltransferase